MSTSTVTVFDPQGVMRDVPQSELQNAVKQGGTPGVRVQAPDGQVHIVPAPKIQEAAQNGGKVLPFTDQEPALTKSFGDYVHDFGKHMWTAVEQSAGAPAVANELYKKWTGQPNQLKEMIPRAIMTFAGAGGFEGELGAAFDSATPKPAPVSEGSTPPRSLLDVAKQDVKAYATKKIPFGSKLGLTTKPATIADYWNALTQSPENTAAPVAKPPEVPPSQANPEQFSFSHRQTGPAYAPGGPVRTSTAVDAAPAQAAPAIPTSPGFRVPPVREPVPIATPLKASDFATATKSVVDEAVPPSNKGANMEAKAKVDFYLKNGNVAGAEKALDQVAAKVNPNWPPAAPQFRGGTNDIREATRFKTAADLQEDHAIQQEMAQNLERHGQIAEEDARKEFIARNSTGISKGELTGQLPSAQGQAIREANAAKVQPSAPPKSVAPGGIKGALQEIENNFPVNPANPGAGTVPVERAVMGAGGPEASFTVAERGGKLRLKGIQNLKPGSGAGNTALKNLTDIADKHNVEMELTASPYGDEATRLDSDRLKSWYEMHGFEPEQGRDPALGYMVRKPQITGSSPKSAPAAETGDPARKAFLKKAQWLADRMKDRPSR